MPDVPADSAKTAPEPADESSPPPIIRPRVLVFFDYACQFCYLDWPRFKRLRDEHDSDVFLVPFELRPALPSEGVPISDIGPGHSERVEEHMRRMAREGELGLVFPTFVPNTHNALALGELGRDLGPEAHEAIHEAIFSAYNAREEDIGDDQVLLGIAEEHGFDRDEVSEVFSEGTYDDRLHQFYHLALALGISATPSALICNELLIGTRPYELLAASLERCLVTEADVAAGLTVTPAEDAEELTPAQPQEGSPATIDH